MASGRPKGQAWQQNTEHLRTKHQKIISDDDADPEAVLHNITAIAARVEKLVGIVLDAVEKNPVGRISA